MLILLCVWRNYKLIGIFLGGNYDIFAKRIDATGAIFIRCNIGDTDSGAEPGGGRSRAAAGFAAQTAAPQPGNVLTLDEAIQIALENHPSIRASKERIGAQEAVVGQQMAAYYPLINMNNFYRSGNQSGTSTGDNP